MDNLEDFRSAEPQEVATAFKTTAGRARGLLAALARAKLLRAENVPRRTRVIVPRYVVIRRIYSAELSFHVT